MNSVLIVDDEEMIQLLLRDEFELEGFIVNTASSGNSAIALLKSGLRPDLVLTDMKMPDGNGIDLLRYISGQKDFMPVIFVLSAFLDAMQEEMVRYAVAGVLSKPFNREVLFKHVFAALEDVSVAQRKSAAG